MHAFISIRLKTAYVQALMPIAGPLSPAICRIGQQIVDSAVLSAEQKRTVPLVGND